MSTVIRFIFFLSHYKSTESYLINANSFFIPSFLLNRVNLKCSRTLMLGLKAVNIASTSSAPLKTPRVTILALLQASEGRVTVICPRNSKAPLK